MNAQYPPSGPVEPMGPAVPTVVDFDTLLGAAAPLPPGGFRDTPFANIRPRTRAEKRAAQDRERLEKDRLRSRRFGHQQYADPGAVVAPATDPSVASYGDAANRFRRDFAAEEKERKAEIYARKQAELDRRRLADAEREALRWAEMDAREAAERERLQNLRMDGGKARKNRSALPYDSVRMQYHGTPDGEALRAQDDALRRRAAVRAAWIEDKSHSVDYDPVTGQRRTTAKAASHPGLHPSADGTLDHLKVDPLRIDPMGNIAQLVGTARSNNTGDDYNNNNNGSSSRRSYGPGEDSSYDHRGSRAAFPVDAPPPAHPSSSLSQHTHYGSHPQQQQQAQQQQAAVPGAWEMSSRKADSPWAPSNLSAPPAQGGRPPMMPPAAAPAPTGGHAGYGYGSGYPPAEQAPPAYAHRGGALAASGRMALGGAPGAAAGASEHPYHSGGSGYQQAPAPQQQYYQQPPPQYQQYQQPQPASYEPAGAGPSGRARLRAEMAQAQPQAIAPQYGQYSQYPPAQTQMQPAAMPMATGGGGAWGAAPGGGGTSAWGGGRR